jgi:exopolysaccharide biosynthesis WecB/TagA/CpsF family protein
VAEVARQRVNEKVGREMIVGTDSPPFDYDRRPGEVDRMAEKIHASKASVLVIGLGAGRQEKFIVENRARLPHVKTFLPLGGTIDYEAGALKRPPAWVTNVGLEWFYRLAKEPKQRWRRYLVHQPPVLYHLVRQRFGLYRDPFGDR